MAGTRLQLTNGSSSRAAALVTDGGTPTRTGTPDLGCTSTTFPSAAASANGLFPNQILTAYGIAPLQAAGLQGQGVRLAIVGEAPTPSSDVNTFRSCFGTTGTSLTTHNAGSIKPIVESSLDAMVSSTVVPKLAGFDLWVQPLSESDDDGDAEGFLQLLAQPVQATAGGAPLPNVISVSYGVCEAQVSPYTASRTLVERQLTATAALGITVVVAAGDTGSSACARGVSPSQLTSADKKPQASWPATSPWVLAVGGTNLTLDDQNAIASSGPWNDTAYPPPVPEDGRRRWRSEHVRGAALVAAGAVVRELQVPDGPRRRRLRRREPGLSRSSAPRACRAAAGPGRPSRSSEAPARPRRSSRAWSPSGPSRRRARACRSPASSRRCSTPWRSAARRRSST